MIQLPELTTRDKKIIRDILFHLDGWRVNDHPHETRKIQSFLDPEEATYDNMVRKEVSSREVLNAYDMAKVHALNYIRRKEFPNNPAIYQAVCYWAAGLLSEKAHFKEDKINQSTLLIEEARRMLEPHVKRGTDFFTVSGDDFFWEEYMRSEYNPRPRRDRIPPRKGDDEEPKERLIHGHFHEPPRDHFHYRPPVKPKHPCHEPPEPLGRPHEPADWIGHRYKSKYDIKVEPIVSVDGEFATIKASVTKNGIPCNRGKLMFYVYEDN